VNIHLEDWSQSHGFRFDNNESGTHARPQAGETNPQPSIGWPEDEPLWLLGSLQHSQLMAKRHDLDLHRGLSPK
jgi:hypothetical protein